MKPSRILALSLSILGVAISASCSTISTEEPRADATGGPYQPASTGLSTPLTSPGASAPYGY